MPKIHYTEVETQYGSQYPGAFKDITNGYERKKIGDYAGLTQFGVNYALLRPGAATSLRHWHENEDELVIVFEGEVVLVDDQGETTLRAGESAGFKAGESNGHHLINKSVFDVILFEIGTRMNEEIGHYSDQDLMVHRKDGNFYFARRDGTKVS